MALQINTTMTGGNADYARYLSGDPVKTDRIGDCDLFDFTLIPFESEFVPLIRGAYIRVRTSAFDPWFTGYITNEPELSFLGYETVAGVKTPRYGYQYEASSDEYLLNIKPVGIFSPFLNMTHGQILRAIINKVDTTDTFDVSGVGPGFTLARYVVDPTKSLKDIAKEFCDAANYMYYASDHKVYFVQRDATPATIVIDGHDKNFTAMNLKVKQTTDPIINDCTVLGGIEPQDYITELFLGDGYTAQFPLMSSVFGSDSTWMLDDDFSGGTVDDTKWVLYDSTSTHILMSNGYVNCIGGNGNMDVSLQSANVFPMEGALRCMHGEYDFVTDSDGVICSFWTTPPNNSLEGCFYGLRVSKTAGTTLRPIVSGVVDTSQSMVINYAYRYIIRTIYSFSELFRFAPTYTAMSDGVVDTYTHPPTPALCDIQTYITAVDPSNATVQGSFTFTNKNVAVDALTCFATYVPFASNDLHLSMTGVTISHPLQASLSVKTPTDIDYVPQMVGPNEMDSLDGLAPIATISDSNNGANTRSSMLGTPKYNPGQAQLQFFKNTSQLTTTVPTVRSFIKLRYRHAGSAIARVSNRGAIATESEAWLDDGVRSMVSTQLSPQPRNSAECEIAALATVAESSHPRFEGSYQQPYPYSFTGEPKAGSIMTFQNLPSDYPSYLTAETITQVTTTMVAKSTLEVFDCQIAFGPIDKLRQLLTNFSTQSDAFMPVDTAEVPNAIDTSAVGLAFAEQLTAIDLSSYDTTNFHYTITGPGAALSVRAGGLIGAFTDALGEVISVFDLNTDLTVVCPAGATQIQFGCNDDVLADNHGAWIMNVNGTSYAVPGTAAPWRVSSTLNTLYPWGVGDGSSPVVAPVEVGAEVSIVYVGGTVSIGGSFPYYGPSGRDVDGTGKGSSGTYNPGHYVTSTPLTNAIEVRYTDDSWGCDDAKNLVGRFTSSPFPVPRTLRGRSVFARFYDDRNRWIWSNDWTQMPGASGYPLVLSHGKNPQGNFAEYTVFTPSGSALSFDTGVTGSAGCWTVALKAATGTTVTLGAGSASKTVHCDGLWQRISVPFTGNSGTVVCTVSSTAVTNLCQSSLELGVGEETVYCKTAGTAYGALSRYPAVIRVALPMIPPPPTGQLTYLDDPTSLTLTITNPTLMTDVWGYEVRASDNTTVLYKADLIDSTYDGIVTLTNNVRVPEVYIYSYNLLGEYSSTGTLVTMTIPTPTVTGLAIDDSSMTLSWSSNMTPPLPLSSMFLVESDDTSNAFLSETMSLSVTALSYVLPQLEFFNHRWLRVTGVDKVGPGTPEVIEHTYTPAAVSEFGTNEQIVVEPPVTAGAPPAHPPNLPQQYWGQYAEQYSSAYKIAQLAPLE